MLITLAPKILLRKGALFIATPLFLALLNSIRVDLARNYHV